MNITPVLNVSILESPVVGHQVLSMTDIIRESCLADYNFIVQMIIIMFVAEIIVGHTQMLIPKGKYKYVDNFRDWCDFLYSSGIWVLAVYLVATDRTSTFQVVLFVIIVVMMLIDFLVGISKKLDGITGKKT